MLVLGISTGCDAEFLHYFPRQIARKMPLVPSPALQLHWLAKSSNGGNDN
jgi:hypothetical protein